MGLELVNRIPLDLAFSIFVDSADLAEGIKHLSNFIWKRLNWNLSLLLKVEAELCGLKLLLMVEWWKKIYCIVIILLLGWECKTIWFGAFCYGLQVMWMLCSGAGLPAPKKLAIFCDHPFPKISCRMCLVDLMWSPQMWKTRLIFLLFTQDQSCALMQLLRLHWQGQSTGEASARNVCGL